MRPAESEIAPWARAYAECVEGDDVLKALETQRDELLAVLARLDGAYRYAPGKWTVAEVLGHINDAERIFAFRTLSIARGEQTPLPPFDQDDYMAAANFAARSLADLTGEFEAIRESSVRLIRSLPAEAWRRRGTVSGFPVTPLGLAFVLAGHEKHHTRILRQKYLSVSPRDFT